MHPLAQALAFLLLSLFLVPVTVLADEPAEVPTEASTDVPAEQNEDRASEIYPGYVWESLGDGIYLHRPKNPLAPPVDGNSTILVGSDGVVVVDTHINPAVARAVVAKIQSITDQPVTHVINTHWHDDHTNGNDAYRQAFPGAAFVAHRATHASLRAEWPGLEQSRLEGFASVKDMDLDARAAELEAEGNVSRAQSVRVYKGYRDALEPEIESMELVYPDLDFEERLELHRAERRIVVQWLGRANTDGDAVVWLPDDGIVLTGDMLVWPIPFAFSSPMTEWVDTLRAVEALGAETTIPGHGEILRDGAYLRQVVDLLEAMLDAVRAAHDADVAYEDLADAVDLAAMEELFTGGDPQRTYAWRSYCFGPGVQSAWTSLGFPVPEPEETPEETAEGEASESEG